MCVFSIVLLVFVFVLYVLVIYLVRGECWEMFWNIGFVFVFVGLIVFVVCCVIGNEVVDVFMFL